MVTAPKSICNKFWKTGEWDTSWTQSLVTNPSQEKEPSTVQELPHNQVDVPSKQEVKERNPSATLADYLEKTSVAYGMVITAENTKQMTNDSSGISRVLHCVSILEGNCHRSYRDPSLKYILSRITQTTTTLSKL